MRLPAILGVAIVSFARPLVGQDDGPPMPGIRVASVNVRVVDALDPPLELPRLPLRPGEPYTQERLDATESVILAELTERGRPYGLVEVSAQVDPAAGTAAVTLDVDPGPGVVFGHITVQAQPPLGEEFVWERVAYQPGDPFRTSALAETETALRDLPVVQAVQITVIGLEVGDTVVATVVAISTPEQVRGVEVRGTLSSIRCLEAAAFWRDRYFLGSPRLFSIGAGMSNLFAAQLGDNFPCSSVGEDEFAQVDYFVDTELQQNLPGRPRTALLTRAFFRQASSPQAYALRGFGGRIAIAHDLLRGRGLTISYSPERNQLRGAGIYFCAEFGACTATEIAAFSRWRWLAPVEVFARWVPPGTFDLGRALGPADQEIWPDPIEPLWRPFLVGSLAVAGTPTGSGFRYGRLAGEAGLTRVTGRRTEVAGRVRLGGLARGDEVIPPQLRFFSGGMNSVRGVSQNMVGPLVLLATTAEVEALGCQPAPGGCPPGLHVDPDRVSARPRGGDALVESSLEGRVWAGRRVQLAAFVDYGLVIGRSFAGDATGDVVSGVRRQASVVTPGLGVRVPTRIGPVRVDVGYDPRGDRLLPLLTEDPETGDVIVIGDVIWNPFTFGDPSGLREFWRRLQVQLSMGQPF